MNYDTPKQPIDGSFAPLEDTLWEMRERQRMADMQRGIGVGNIYDDLLKLKLSTDNLANEQLKTITTNMKAKAKTLSDRELLEEIYAMLKTRFGIF